MEWMFLTIIIVVVVFLAIGYFSRPDKQPKGETQKQAPSPPPSPHLDDLVAEKERYLLRLEVNIEDKTENIDHLKQEIVVAREELEALRKSKIDAEEQFKGVFVAEERSKTALSNLKKQIDEVSVLYASEYQKLNDLRAATQAIIEEQKRKALEDIFYKVNVSEINRQRIQDIVAFAARFPEIKAPIMSAIYSHYYAAEVASMCNRVLGTGRRTGIYKITNSLNGMVYVGKSVDIRNRWTQHVKRAVGVEKETQNLLYPAMREYGVWNFSFEVLEDCLKEHLNTKEKFYQEVYKAKEDYSIK